MFNGIGVRTELPKIREDLTPEKVIEIMSELIDSSTACMAGVVAEAKLKFGFGTDEEFQAAMSGSVEVTSNNKKYRKQHID